MFKLIIVDDELDARDNMIACINWAQHGLQVVATADDGLTAYDLILREKPDLVLIDIKMPGISGLEVIHRIQQSGAASPAFIIVSGYDDFSYAQQAIDLRVSGYLLKPFSPDDLLQAMHKAIRKTAVLDDIDRAPPSPVQTFLESLRQSPSASCLFYPDQKEREIISCLSTGSREQLDHLLEDFLSATFYNNDSFSQIFDCFLILYAEICRTLAQRGYYLSEDHFSQEALGLTDDPREIICSALRSICAEAFQLLNEANSSGYIIKQTIAYIETHYQEKLSLNTLAAQVYVSPVYLSNLFSRIMGKTITEYIQKFRVDKAKELLKNPELAISDIAEEVGYSDIKYFAQVFKKIIGVTPTNFRNQLH